MGQGRGWAQGSGEPTCAAVMSAVPAKAVASTIVVPSSCRGASW